MFAKRVELGVVEPLPSLTDEEELCIFRIVQEALQNIQKHAETDQGRIELAVSPRDRCLILTIDDQGRGFNPAITAPRHGQGAGMPGMRERARLIGAELAIESQPGAGTTVRLRIPLRGQTGSLQGLDPDAGP
jgi:signal transduction histidine kinase